MNAKTSVIIVTWNGKHHLEHCLPALTAQTRPPDEIIIVDNASSDDSVAYIKTNYPEVKLIELGENRGFSGGNIAGYEVASGDYVVLLNNDTKPLADWLEQLVHCADAHADVGIVASLMTDWAGVVIDTAGDGCSVTGRGFKRYNNYPATTPLPSGYVFSACAGAALYKRATLEEVGFLDPRFFMYGEDTDLAFRAQLGGWKVFFCAESVVRHRISGSEGVLSDNAVYYSSRNNLWVYLKCMPTPLILKHSPSHAAHLLWILVSFSRRGQAAPYLRGTVDALKKLPLILQDRRAVQRSRRVNSKSIEKQLTPLVFLRKFRQSGQGAS